MHATYPQILTDGDILVSRLSSKEVDTLYKDVSACDDAQGDKGASGWYRLLPMCLDRHVYVFSGQAAHSSAAS